MRTVKQVSDLTGISVRALQFYDEIGLLKPTAVTEAGYRLYGDHALETLQQILFFKELDFKLKEIKTILEDPGFDKTAAFCKQRELLQLKRDRLNSLLDLLDKLIQGETCMDFTKFDMSDYFRALTEFKTTHTKEIVEQMGSLESFDQMLDEMKGREGEIAGLAVQQYGSVEKFTEAMKTNFSEFLAHGPSVPQGEVPSRLDKTDALTRTITADLSRDVASPEVQAAVQELVALLTESNGSMDMGENYWSSLVENYLSSPVFIQVTDKKYGEGAANFLGRALKAHLSQR